MKRIVLLIVCLIMIALVACSCAEDIEYYKTSVMSYPDRILYVQNVDTMLDLTGLKYQKICRDASRNVTIEVEEGLVDHEGAGDGYERIETNVDFTKEGIYEVTVYVLKGVDAGEITFSVQVMSQENIAKLAEGELY